MTKKILCIGSTMHDVFIEYNKHTQTLCWLKKDEVVHIAMKEGKKIEIDALIHRLGGGAANSATAFALFGMQAHIVSAIGDDHAGTFAIGALQTNNVNTHFLITKEDESTGTSFILPCPSGNRPILVHRAANLSLNNDDIPYDEFTQMDALYITSLSGQTSDLLPTITQKAKQHNCFVATNPGSSQLTENVQTLIASLPHIDVLVCNQFEAELLFAKLAPKQPFSIESYLKTIQSRGPNIVAVTCGKDGVHAFDGQTIYFQESLKTSVICTVGAGDAFSATFVACLINGEPVENALKMGIKQSAFVIGTIGATQGLLSLEVLKNS